MTPKPLICSTCRSAERTNRKGGLARYTCRGCGRTMCHHLSRYKIKDVGSCSRCARKNGGQLRKVEAKI